MVKSIALVLSALVSADLLFLPFRPEQIPADEISSLYQDSDGYIWIVSYSGLSRYDGYRTVSYTIGPDSDDAQTIQMHSVIEAGDGLYIATENGKDVVIEGFLQAKYEYSEAYKNTSLYLADGDGAYFVYRYATTPEDYAKLEVGAKLRITGTKDQWSGETEVKDVTKLEVVGTDKWIADPVDVTATIGSDAVAADNNKAVVIKGAVVAASKIKDDAKEYAFLYKHDGSGAQGDDIYFNVTIGGKDYTFVVESDFFGKDSEIYKAVEALKIGDKIDIGGFLYWYNAPQVQVTSVAASK